MGNFELRLGDADRVRFAGPDHPEWVLLDLGALDDIPFDAIHRWETEIRETDRTSIQEIISAEWADATALGIKGAVWLAWKMAGLETPPWAEFNIRTNAVRGREVGDAVPPPEGSTEPSSEKPPRSRKRGRS